MMREAIGGAFKGSRARAASNRNNHGSESIRSIVRTMHLSQKPPKYPAMPPTIIASNVAANAAAGARRSEIRVANRSRTSRSRPNSSVPSRNAADGRAPGISRYCVA